MIRRAVMAVAALAAVGAFAATAVVAAAFALYALLKDTMGPAGASACVAAAAALIIGLVALVAMIQARGRAKAKHAEPGLIDRLGVLARERPMLSAGAALLAGLMALRNPQLVATAIAAFLAPKPRELRRR